ncbi:MAG: exodeoxyribonuclease VII large subunit [Synergistaceae bacterium]|jgi:exodeoxyribonuclease VII large subunit|nr:exodeoxyribonuclease VII large subunit [Synergistaceae bacterium]
MVPALFDAAPAGIQTVDELSNTIRAVINRSALLKTVTVRGEIQNFKRHGSGHVYFTLAGEESRIAAVLWRSYSVNVISWPRDGDEVIAAGSVDVYTKTGSYQLYATRLTPLGVGAQLRAREELRRALENEGLFDPRHKRPIPKYPSKIAVITSPTGAAVKDILEVSSKRAPYIDIVIIPAVVQGLDAPPQISRALALAGRVPGAECVILARGGGARDDLSPFDDERIARAVRSCPLPVVTGVGHQIDSSLADLAADAALPTPSAAAERVFPDMAETMTFLSACGDNMRSRVENTMFRNRTFARQASEKLTRSMNAVLNENENRLRETSRELARMINASLERGEMFLTKTAAALDAMSPLAVLGRGFSVCKDERGHAVTDASSLSPGDKLFIRFHAGSAEAEVSRADGFI